MDVIKIDLQFISSYARTHVRTQTHTHTYAHIHTHTHIYIYIYISYDNLEIQLN